MAPQPAGADNTGCGDGPPGRPVGRSRHAEPHQPDPSRPVLPRDGHRTCTTMAAGRGRVPADRRVAPEVRTRRRPARGRHRRRRRPAGGRPRGPGRPVRGSRVRGPPAGDRVQRVRAGRRTAGRDRPGRRPDRVQPRDAPRPRPPGPPAMTDLTPAPAPGGVLPVLPLKNTVLFPFLFAPLSVGRPASRAAVEAALASEDKTLVVAAQRNPADEAPGLDALYPVGTRAVIKKMARTQDAVEILVQGVERVILERAEQTEPYLKAVYRVLPLPTDAGTEVEGLQRAVLDAARRVLEL